jgi:hypothetical protein
MIIIIMDNCSAGNKSVHQNGIPMDYHLHYVPFLLDEIF